MFAEIETAFQVKIAAARAKFYTLIGKFEESDRLFLAFGIEKLQRE